MCVCQVHHYQYGSLSPFVCVLLLALCLQTKVIPEHQGQEVIYQLAEPPLTVLPLSPGNFLLSSRSSPYLLPKIFLPHLLYPKLHLLSALPEMQSSLTSLCFLHLIILKVFSHSDTQVSRVLRQSDEGEHNTMCSSPLRS